jgi:hypothetical protein
MLNWKLDLNARSYEIFKKRLGDDAWSLVSTLTSSNVTTWTDGIALAGVRYEYMIHKVTGSAPDGYGYICAGIRAPAIEDRGKLILLVEQSLASPLSFGLARLQQDLVGDGWRVLRFDVTTNTPVTAVKELIRSNYNADPVNTKGLLLFGHIPVPYSGYIAPDGHDDHRGAWPADVYYGDMDGQWTDVSVTATNVANPLNRNVPGDGKFDQSEPPGKVRLQVGRVDLSWLTCFANKTPARYELDLARQYLAKNHAFRQGQMDVPRQGLIFNRSGGLEEEPQASSAYRAFPGFFGTQIKPLGFNEFLTETETNTYLWLDVAGTGGSTGVDGVCSSDDLATHDPKVVFSAWSGSYFGDWDRESNFMRAMVASGSYSLATVYCGQPPWFFHPMSLGGTIGEITQLTQNNHTNGIYLPHRNFGVGEVHIALLGDPTLRLHPIAPPQNVSVKHVANGIQVQWSASSDAGVFGYNIYRATSAGGPYTKISGSNAVTTTQFTDVAGSQSSFYMVRAVKLESTPAGTYYNLSQGAFYPDPFSAPAPPAPTDFGVRAIVPGGVTFFWNDPSGSATGYVLERRSLAGGVFQPVAQFPGVDYSGTDSTVTRGRYMYRLKAVNPSGDSTYTAQAEVNLDVPFGLSVGNNNSLAGNWIGSFGDQGYVIYDWVTNVSASLDLSLSNALSYIGSLNSKDARALRKPNSTDGVMAVRNAVNGTRGMLEVNLRFLDSDVHKVAVYQLGEMTGTIRVIDPFTGQVLASNSYLGTTNEGVYTIFDVRNSVNLLVSTPTNRQPQINGIFISTPTLDAPEIDPPGGGFWGKTDVTITTLPNATVYYTTDGKVPTTNSIRYSGAFSLTTNATILARAFAPGYPDSPVSVATLTNALTAAAAYVRTDTTTKGDWMATYGQDSSVYYGMPPIYVDYAEVALNGGTPFIWSDTTTDIRALSKNNQDTRRLATTWYAADELTLDLTIYTEEFHCVALYFLDWDQQGRIEQVTLTDAAGNVLDQRSVDTFSNGKYLVWNARGSVHARIRRVAGVNVVLSGIFIGPAQQISQAPAHLGLSTASAGTYSLRIEGFPGQSFDVQYSTDFRNWTTIVRRTLTSTSTDWSFTAPDAPGYTFYRAVLSGP